MRTLFFLLAVLAVAASMVLGVWGLVWSIGNFVRYQDGIKGEVTALECSTHWGYRLDWSDCSGRFTANAGGLAIAHVTFGAPGRWEPGDHGAASVPGPHATSATLAREAEITLGGGIAVLFAFTGGPVVVAFTNWLGVRYYRKKERSKPGYQPPVKKPWRPLRDHRPGRHERKRGGGPAS